jgi:hypothetical protein
MGCLLHPGASLRADSIEAVKGKHYKLTKRHGPWMIMVASFLKPPDDRRSAGMTPEQAAEELVYELRLKGIPAYVYKQDEVEGTVKTINRHTQEERAGKIHGMGGVCVLAGNYKKSDELIAQRTLKYIKTYRPHFLQDVAAEGAVSQGDLYVLTKSGGVFRTTKNHPGPLSAAFMTTNPILTEDEIAVRTHDPLILQLNSGAEYSLMGNKGKYTVVVATFQGTSQTQLAEQSETKKVQFSSSLGEAANRAWELCTALRGAKSLGYDQNYDAFVYHDRYSSIVTVGSFKTKNDPRISELQNAFGAKVTSVMADVSPTLGAELFTIPKKPTGTKTDKFFIFDPFPHLMDVPT